MSEDVKTIKHIIVKEKPEPTKQPEKPKEKIDDDKAEFLARASERFFEDEKEKLVAEYPEHASKIRKIESGFDLELVREKLEEDKIPQKPPSGKAKLPTQPDYTTSLDRAKNEGDLINRLYGQAKTTDRQQAQQKLEALEKIDKMYKSVVENPKLGARVKDIPNAVRDFNLCPKCGTVQKFNPNIKGSECPNPKCDFVSGMGSYTRKVY